MTKTLQKRSSSQEPTYLPLDDTNKYLYSPDLALVAYLLCKNFELAGMDKAVKNKVTFIIKRNGKEEAEMKKFWDFKSSVDAQTYFNQIKRLKNQIFSSD